MNYKVLARRWRPLRFADLVGQDVVVRTLQNALGSENLAHAYLLAGIRGVGKTTIARLLAMAINCEKAPVKEPCGQCQACKSISHGSNLDVQEMDAASHTGVDDIREILDAVRYPPTSLKWKVYIIDEAHMLSNSAFNALLKTLEEPPERVMFILATTSVEKLPVTVRSRCQRFDLRRQDVSEICAYLGHVLKEEKIAYEAEAIIDLARAADGSIRDALSLAERVLAFAGNHLEVDDVRMALGLVGPEIMRSFSEAVFSGDAKAAVDCLRMAGQSGHLPRRVLEASGVLWHQLSCQIVDEELVDSETGEEHRAWLRKWSENMDAKSLDLRYQVLIHGLRDLALMDELRGAEMLAMRLSGLNEIMPVAACPQSNASELKAEKKECDHPPQPPMVVQGQHPQSETEPDLPLENKKTTPGMACDNWDKAVKAYAKVRPAMAAMLEHVLCLDFSSRVRLALDEHQQKAIAMPERMAFAEWLGREVHWEPKQDQDGETLSQARAKQADAKQKQLWKTAEDDPHVQMLMREMDAKLVGVRPPGAQDEVL